MYTKDTTGISIIMALIITLMVFCIVFIARADDSNLSKSYTVAANNLETLTNSYREESNLPQLMPNSFLRETAYTKAKEMCDSGKFSHDRPNGKKFSTIFYEKEGNKEFKDFSENIARGFLDDESTMNGFKKSALHNNNMLDTWTNFGTATVECEKDGKIYSVQHFARIKQ